MLVGVLLVIILVLLAVKAGYEANMLGDLPPEDVKLSALPTFLLLSLGLVLLTVAALVVHMYTVIP